MWFFDRTSDLENRSFRLDSTVSEQFVAFSEIRCGSYLEEILEFLEKTAECQCFIHFSSNRVGRHTHEWVMLLCCAVGVLVMGAVKRCTSLTDRSEGSPNSVRVFESDLDAVRYTVWLQMYRLQCDYRSILRN